MTYVWEVKPISYASGDKKDAAIAQLNKYVESLNAEAREEGKVQTYEVGGTQIEDGEIKVEKDIERPKGTEHVVYIIKYTVQEDGLILYSFERHSQMEERNEENVPVTVPEEAVEKVTESFRTVAVGDLFENPGYVMAEEPSIDWELVRNLLTISTSLQPILTEMNSKELSRNTVTIMLQEAAIAFMAKVGRYAAGVAAASFVTNNILPDGMLTANAEELENMTEDEIYEINQIVSE